MWAASSLEFAHPLIIGETATRASRILDIVLKHGRSGMLIFVKLEHATANGGGRVALTEIQDIKYREKPGDVTPAAALAARAPPMHSPRSTRSLPLP